MPTTTTSASSVDPSLSRTRSTRVVPSIASTPGVRAHLDPVVGVHGGAGCSHVVAERAYERHRQGFEDRHLEAALAGRGRDLGSDEAGADDHHSARRLVELGPDREAVLERAQHVDALEVGRAGDAPWRRAGREDHPVVGEHLAVVERDGLRGWVEGRARAARTGCRGRAARSPPPCEGGCRRARSSPASTRFDNGGRS